MRQLFPFPRRFTLERVAARARFHWKSRLSFRGTARIGCGCFFASGASASTEVVGTVLEIGNGVQVNRNVFLDVSGGLVIEDRAVIGAGAVVTRDVPANAIVAGVAARAIGWRKEAVR